jgi:hypothetical protein
MTGTLIASAASPEVTASREAFAACARKSLDAYEKIEGVTPAGLAFFTGLSCARAREDYRQALTTSGARDVERMMQAIDARMINFILGDWADKKLKQ